MNKENSKKIHITESPIPDGASTVAFPFFITFIVLPFINNVTCYLKTVLLTVADVFCFLVTVLPFNSLFTLRILLGSSYLLCNIFYIFQ